MLGRASAEHEELFKFERQTQVAEKAQPRLLFIYGFEHRLAPLEHPKEGLNAEKFVLKRGHQVFERAFLEG